MQGPMVYHFLDLEFCPQTRELRRDGELLPLGSRAIDVLEHLIQHRDRVVSCIDSGVEEGASLVAWTR